MAMAMMMMTSSVRRGGGCCRTSSWYLLHRNTTTTTGSIIHTQNQHPITTTTTVSSPTYYNPPPSSSFYYYYSLFPPSFTFFRRGFAKGRKSKGDDDDDGSTVVTVDKASVKASAVSLMEAAVESLSRELSKLRTGRASPGMLDHIIVETSGVKMPLSRMAVTSVIDSKTLSVTPYDPNTLKELECAIVASPLGLNPKPDGNRLIAHIPPLTKEHMQAVCKVVAKSAEDVKQSIRRARQKALDPIKKASSSLSKDDVKRFEKEIDELTKKFIKSAEDMCKAKEKEISSSS